MLQFAACAFSNKDNFEKEFRATIPNVWNFSSPQLKH